MQSEIERLAEQAACTFYEKPTYDEIYNPGKERFKASVETALTELSKKRFTEVLANYF